jgi:predicted glycoside hydrolase/deacetylase ChbG (UPF0249 family)
MLELFALGTAKYSRPFLAQIYSIMDVYPMTVIPQAEDIKAQDRFLVLNADEGGMQKSFNQGILSAHLNGVLTSVSLLPNGLALDDALENVVSACPDLGVGIHLCLTEGRVIGRCGGLLSDSDGNFRYKRLVGYARMLALGASRALRSEVKDELRAQIEFLGNRVPLDHLDGHMHIHAIPWIFELALSLAEEYKIPFIRLPMEHLLVKAWQHHFPSPLNMLHWAEQLIWCVRNRGRLAASSVRSSDHFFGVIHVAAMSLPVVADLLTNNTGHGVIEILFHPIQPAKEDSFISPRYERLCLSDGLRQEHEALISSELRDLIAKKGYLLTNYRRMAMGGQPLGGSGNITLARATD